MGGKLTFRRIGGRIVPIITNGNVKTPLRTDQQTAKHIENFGKSIPKLREKIRNGNRHVARQTKTINMYGKMLGMKIASIKKGKK